MTQRFGHARLTGSAILALGLLASCGRAEKPPPRPKAAVDVVTLHPADVAIDTELPGRVTAHRVADIRPQVSGVILKRLFTEGDVVRAGQQLYQVDPRPYEASLASARASLAKARAAVVAAQDLDNAVASLAADQADVASGEASVRSAEINLAYTRMDAPITGRTGRSSVTEGALVTQNQTDSLVTVTELDPIYVDVTETSGTLLRLKREMANGQLQRDADGTAAVSLTLEDGTAYPSRGKLLFSEVNVDQSTGSVVLRAVFPNSEGLLLPGMFVRETIREGIRANALLVPQRGVTHDERGQPTALVVGNDGKVAMRSLVTDRAIGGDWLVSKGLAAGDHVIVSGVQQARPGALVDMREVVVDGATLKPAPTQAAPQPPSPSR
jgi:membrane fusion protein (multidrug efflux system)